MELLNESPPTGGVLNTVSSSPSTASSAAVFSSQGALSASSSSSTSADINNLNSGLSSASFCLALGTSNFVNSLPSSGNENLLDNQRFLNETHLNDKLSSVRNQSDFATLPISTSINSIKSSSSSTSSSSSCASLNSNFSSPSSTFSLCAQNLFSSANIQHQHSVKVKRTRQRVDAGEPRNSYASIANYASNRLGKTTKNFQTPLLPPPNKGLLDQLSPYLGLNALLSSNNYSPEDFTNSLNNQSNNSINNLLASLAVDKNTNSPPLFSKSATEVCSPKTNKLSNNQQMLLLDHQKHQKNSPSPLNWDTITNRSLNNSNNLQCELLNSSYAGLVTANLVDPIIDKNMAKSRFPEDALTLEYNAKVSKHSDFIETNQLELPTDSSLMTPNDLLLSVKSVSNIMENNEEESLAQDQTKQNDENVSQTAINDENDKNTENNSHKSPDSECEDSENRKRSHMSASNSNSSRNSSRCSSPDLDEDSQVIRANESKRFRVDNIVNNLAAERINSNSSCNSNSSSLAAAKFSNSVNGCKNRRKLNQPQQCKASNEEDLDELEEDIGQQSVDEEEEEDEEDDNSTGQQMNLSLRKPSLAHEDIDKFKSQFESFLRLCEQQQLQQQQQQNNFNVNSNSNNLRSTRVSDRGRLNGTLHSNNNSATSTPVNLSINSPRPNDVDDEYLSSSRNQEFYDDKNDIDNVSLNGLSNNLCKELCHLVDELQKAFCSKKLFLNLQEKMRVRLNLLLNCNSSDLDLEQFFLDIKELLSNSILQTVESNFNRFKMNILLKNFTYNGSFNNSNSFNNLTNNLTSSNNLNQSSKNLNQAAAVALHNKQQLRNKNDSQIDNLRSNFVDQLNNRFNFNNRSSHQAGLLAGLENNSANTALSNKLFSQALNSNNSFNDFKTPSPFGILPDNSNLAIMQHLSFLAQQEQLQKENQQDSALSLITPKRKRIKASDEPRRTRTSNRLPSNPLSNSMNSQQSKTTSEMIANLVSRELNSSTPKTNLHLPTNNIISGSSLSNTEQLNLDAHFNTNSTNNTSVNNSNNVFPFNNSFINSLNTADQLEVQQIMLAAAAASHNNGLNLNNGNNSSNRASPLSSFGNLSTGQTPFNLLDPSPENSINNDCGLDGSEITTTLSPVHLRKAKLMFFYVRYPSSNVLKTYFRDIKFNKNNTAQLVKWFSNFREFYYQQVDKYARQELSNGRKDVNEIHVPSDSELLKVLNVHYNRQNHISVPESFRVVVEQTVREFFRAIQAGKDDNEPSWRKPIYKVISRLDTTVPECFRQPNFLEALESNNFTEL